MSEIRYTSRGMRKRGDDKWEVTLSYKDPETGELKPSYHTIEAKTEKQAKKKRDELILKLEREKITIRSSMLVEEWLDKYVSFKERSGTVQASTISDYKKSRNAVCKRFGKTRLRDLTSDEVDDWMADLRDEGFQPKTIRKRFHFLKQALKHAVGKEIIGKNVCEFCTPPTTTKKEVYSLDKAERSRMLELARKAVPDPLAMAIILALTTGMRRGEVCALRWSDFSDEGTITVNHALGSADGVFYEKDPKTQSSARTIPLTGYVYELLKAARAQTMKTMSYVGLPVGDFYILGTQEPDSKPYSPSRLSREFKSFCRMNNFDCTFHDLRHTFATMMIASGTDVRTVASYLGHSNVAMTLNTYADVDPDAKKAAVSKIVESFNENLATGFDEDLLTRWAEEKEGPEKMLESVIEEMETTLSHAKAVLDKMRNLDGGVIKLPDLKAV